MSLEKPHNPSEEEVRKTEEMMNEQQEEITPEIKAKDTEKEKVETQENLKALENVRQDLKELAPKKESIVERVVGKMPETERQEILQGFKERFNNPTAENRYGTELQKTQEETELINLANSITNELREKYGLDTFDIEDKNIHITKQPKEMVGTGGGYNPGHEAAFVYRSPTKSETLHKILHEMIHMKSNISIQKTAGGNQELQPYRMGVFVVDRFKTKHRFNSLNEAITEELTKRSMESGKDPMTEFPYEKEREFLSNLVEKIHEKNQDVFLSKDEVFDVFAKAMFTGNLLPVGRLMDKFFGRGTFEKLANADSYELSNGKKLSIIDTLRDRFMPNYRVNKLKKIVKNF